MEHRREPAFAGAALAVEQDARKGPAETARPPGDSFLAEKPGEAEDLGERGAERVGLINQALFGHGLAKALIEGSAK